MPNTNYNTSNFTVQVVIGGVTYDITGFHADNPYTITPNNPSVAQVAYNDSTGFVINEQNKKAYTAEFNMRPFSNMNTLFDPLVKTNAVFALYISDNNLAGKKFVATDCMVPNYPDFSVGSGDAEPIHTWTVLCNGATNTMLGA